MASADVTVGLKPSTIESDTTEKQITLEMIGGGVLAHHDGTTVSVAFSQDVQAAGGAGNGNRKGQLELSAGDSVRIPKGMDFIKHKTGAGSATLWYVPDVTSPTQV